MSRLSTKQKILLKALGTSYFVISNACKEARIERKTYYRWLEQPKFKRACDEIEQDLLHVIEDRLKVEALNRQPWAVRFFLSRRHPSYKPKLEVSEGYNFDFIGEEETSKARK
jgi:hypothetical protein